MVYLDTNNALSQGSKPHNHTPDNLIKEKSTFFSSLKRKAADQRITATQNIVSEVLEGTSKDLNKKLPNIDSISRVVQRSRAKSSGSIHSESSDAKLFVLPPNCLTTANNDNFVLFDGEASNGSRMIVFSTTRNLSTLADYPNWIGDGTFYVAPRMTSQSYSFHSMIKFNGKCVPLVFALLCSKHESTYTFLLKLIYRGADMTYVGMHTNIADSCAPCPDNCAPCPDNCAPGPDSCAPGPDSCAPGPDSCAPDNCPPVYMMTYGAQLSGSLIQSTGLIAIGLEHHGPVTKHKFIMSKILIKSSHLSSMVYSL